VLQYYFVHILCSLFSLQSHLYNIPILISYIIRTDSKGVEPMNNIPSAMETVLPQRSHNRRSHNNNPRRPGRGYSTSDGYENSGHDTGWHSTEDDNTDYYLVTEDDRDNDTDGGKAVGEKDDEFGALTTNFSLLDVKGDKPTTTEDQKDEKEIPTTPKSSPLPPAKTSSKKKRSRRRPNKSKKSQTESPQLNSMQEAEELDCHTPMKTTVQQQQSQQTPKRTKQKNRVSPNQQQQKQQVDEDDEKEVHDPHEDDDDYPSSMVTTTTLMKTMEGEFCEPCGPKEEVQQKRTLDEELSYLRRISPTRYQVSLGFVPNMKVPAEIIVNNDLQTLLVQELRDACCDPKSEAGASFIPAIRQAANVAALPGIVRASLAMPDVHSGYGFCIGNVAAFDMDDPTAVISPGGVGFDINCGVRLIRTNLTEDDVEESVREELAEAMFRNIPVGVGAGGDIPCNIEELDKLLLNGIDWAIEQGYAWKEDKEHCEEDGCMDTADPKCVSSRAKKRGLKQIGTLGAGNHYAEIQVVDEIYDTEAAETMGIGKVGQVCIMIHTGSRGLGHQVATDALTVMERAMARDKIDLNDRQLSCARISSKEGKEYLGELIYFMHHYLLLFYWVLMQYTTFLSAYCHTAGMSAAANFAWVNRACITYLTRKAFSEVFKRTADEMDMHLVYDVCHNIAKVEKHTIDGEEKTLLVHRKGSTRAFPPYHKNIPEDYQSIGQPVLIGGTMGTCSYVCKFLLPP